MKNYYELLENSTYIDNVNSGIIVTEENLGGKGFNTGQLGPKTDISNAIADHSKPQSNISWNRNTK